MDREKILAFELFQLAERRGIVLSIAESCTGGQISAALTQIPGISKVFYCGLVTYANEAKEQFLSVARELLEKHGAVSEEVAKAMARGVQERTGSDLVAAVTGVAGPGGGSEKKPIGTIYIAILYRGSLQSYRHSLKGEREEIQAETTLLALKHLIEALQAEEV